MVLDNSEEDDSLCVFSILNRCLADELSLFLATGFFGFKPFVEFSLGAISRQELFVLLSDSIYTLAFEVLPAECAAPVSKTDTFVAEEIFDLFVVDLIDPIFFPVGYYP